MKAFDDVSGEELNPKEVMKARLNELEYIRTKGVWRKMSRRKANELGIKIIKTRWIDINKGDLQNMLIRSRFVAKEFNTTGGVKAVGVGGRDGRRQERAWGGRHYGQ